MRKLHFFSWFLLFVLFIPGFLFAQIKPVDGKVFEVGFNPFNSTNIYFIENGTSVSQSYSTILVNQLIFKRIEGLKTYRYGINFDFLNEKESIEGGSNTFNRYQIGGQIGTEYHKEGTERLSPYFGLLFGTYFKYVGQTIKEGNNTTTISNGWIYRSEYSDTVYLNDRSSFNIYGNFLIGCDYYFAKDFYIGYEIKCGINHSTLSKVTKKSEYHNEEETETLYRQSNSFSLFKGDSSTLKLGYRF